MVTKYPLPMCARKATDRVLRLSSYDLLSTCLQYSMKYAHRLVVSMTFLLGSDVEVMLTTPASTMSIQSCLLPRTNKEHCGGGATFSPMAASSWSNTSISPTVVVVIDSVVSVKHTDFDAPPPGWVFAVFLPADFVVAIVRNGHVVDEAKWTN